jgi:N-acylneuraminate cytidylyltransferase
MIVSIQTARKGSKSVIDKNIIDVGGKRLFLHSIDIVSKSSYVSQTFVSTDCPVIKTYSKSNNFTVIDRPDYLASDDSSHHETMIHAILAAELATKKKIDLIVFLLGNTICAPAKDIDLCIEKMLSDKSIDSVQSVSKFNMFNPYRAHTINKNGMLKTVVGSSHIKSSNDKDAAGNIWFNNGSFFICRRDTVLSKKGASPFPWLGHNILPFQEDIKMEVDAKWQLEWLQKCFIGKK